MTKSCLITLTEHAKLCIDTYLMLLKGEMTVSDYVVCINTHSNLANDRIYRYYESGKIKSVDEFNKAKSEISKTHIKYLRSANHV